MKTGVLIVGAVLATAVVAWVIGSRSGTVDPPASVASTPPAATGSIPVERREAVATAPPELAKPTIDVDLRHAFTTSRNYRELIAKAKTEVERGGAAYVMFAISQCGIVRATDRELQKNPHSPPENTRDIVARAEAKTLLDARCGPLMDQELDMLAYWKALKANGDFQRDPLMTLWGSAAAVASKNDPEARRHYVEAVLETQDPLLWDRSPGTMVATDPKTRKIFFDGAVYDAQEPALLAGRSLVVCGLGFACDAGNDTVVAITCLQWILCEHDRFELAKRQAEAKGYPFERVMMFYDRMVAAFKEKRVDAFVPPA